MKIVRGDIIVVESKFSHTQTKRATKKFAIRWLNNFGVLVCIVRNEIEVPPRQLSINNSQIHLIIRIKMRFVVMCVCTLACIFIAIDKRSSEKKATTTNQHRFSMRFESTTVSNTLAFQHKPIFMLFVARTNWKRRNSVTNCLPVPAFRRTGAKSRLNNIPRYLTFNWKFHHFSLAHC